MADEDGYGGDDNNEDNFDDYDENSLQVDNDILDENELEDVENLENLDELENLEEDNLELEDDDILEDNVKKTCMYNYADEDKDKDNEEDTEEEEDLEEDDLEDETKVETKVETKEEKDKRIKTNNNSNNVVQSKDRISKPVLTKYERIRLLSNRAKQISLGAKPMIKNSKGLNSKEIANLEISNNVIPLIVIRPMPNGKREKWYIRELEHD
jgi:DNA-directed RNA polymerase I, II, and III subunit RPABC2